ncbi:glycosyltransferase family 2 protein [Pseudooceanicola nitratireducens]|uniref:glycosyltransferase family 2 protein n=1 Tax=Pseudooceanicola nitratireducens TaxID=517719 RepID=UPI003C7A851A
MTHISALTIAAGRAEHLRNVVAGFQAQTVRPDELIIGVMQDEAYDGLPETDFPVRQIFVAGPELPLAAARNAVAAAASGDLLVFVDVDCIPHPNLVFDYLSKSACHVGLLMGEVGYLPGGATSDGLDYAKFEQLAVRHSDRQGPPAEGISKCKDYRCFWSLNFAIDRHSWTASGGFDERYVGYGGEDTDYGRTLDELGIPIHWIKGAKVFHQYHPHCMPPIHQVRSVVRNSELFASKWGHRTMEHWLYAFRLMGLIENARTGIRILRDPDDADYALCSQMENMPYASTRRVIDKLDQAQDKATGAARVAQVEKAQSVFLLPAAE